MLSGGETRSSGADQFVFQHPWLIVTKPRDAGAFVHALRQLRFISRGHPELARGAASKIEFILTLEKA